MKDELTLLIVEDNRDNRDLLIRMLKRSGYEGIPASSAEEALNILDVMIIHLMLIDINLPGKSGVELLKEIRQTPRIKDMPAIAITANTIATSRKLCEDAGFDSFLSKPITRKELISEIVKLLA